MTLPPDTSSLDEPVKPVVPPLEGGLGGKGAAAGGTGMGGRGLFLAM